MLFILYNAYKNILYFLFYYLNREILTNSFYSSKCDVFSFGLVIFELLFGFNYFFPEKV